MSANPDRIRSELERSLANGRFQLPPLPEVAKRVLEVSHDPRAGAHELAELVHDDPALAAEVLKSANSVAYGGRVTITSLEQAIARLGMQHVMEICVAASIRQGVFINKGFRSELNLLWRQSLATGLFAKEIARRVDGQVDGAFLSGLLQRLGSALTLRALLEARGAGATRLAPDVLQSLDDALCVPFGMAAARQWGLPPDVTEIIRLARLIEDGVEPVSGPAAQIRLASWLARRVLAPDDEKLDESLLDPLLEQLEMSREDFEAILAVADDVLETVEVGS